LHWAAWEDAPAATVGAATAEERQKCREAWQAWWQKQGAALDLGKMAAEPRVPRLLLVVDSEVTGNYPNRTVVNRVSLCGCDGQPRWMFKGAPFPERKALRDARGPYFAQLVPGNRVLIDDGVRDLQGKLVWKSQWVDTLLTARRLPTGNFFFASSMHVEEVTPDNQLLYSFRQEDHRRSNLFRFSPGWVDRLPNGDLRSITIDPDREVHVCEFQGHPRKELSRVRLTIDPGPYWQCETLPNLHYLLSSSSKNIVWELSADGQICRERRLRYLLSSHLLPNGNLLVHGGPIGMPMEYGQAVLEIDRQDKVHTEVLLLATGIERIQVCLGLVSFGFGRSPQPTEDLLTSVPYQIKKLKSRDSRVRQSACAALSELGRKAEAAVPLLLEMLTGEDKELANSASGVLLKVAGPTACPEAGKLLKHARPDVRWTAVHILSNNWPASKEFFPQIVEKLKDEDASVREAAVWMFGLIGGRDEKEVISHLVQAALEDKEDIVRCYAVQALGKIGPDAKSSVPALLKLLKGDNLYLRAPASAALAAIAPEKTEVIEALVDALQDKDEVLRFRVAMVLGTLGSAPKNVVSALREAARTDPDKQVREKAEEAMRKIQGKK